MHLLLSLLLWTEGRTIHVVGVFTHLLDHYKTYALGKAPADMGMPFWLRTKFGWR